MKKTVLMASLLLAITSVSAAEIGATSAIDLKAEASASFSDVMETTGFVDAIGYVKSEGLVQGYADGTFRPEANINRYDFTKILVGANFSAEQIAACDVNRYAFPDVPTDQWFSPFVCTARMNGIINGYGDGTFQGQNQVSLPEALKIILETYKVDTAAYEEPGANWYQKYLDAAIEAGLLTEIGSDITYQITRGDMAELIFVQETGGEVMADGTSESSDTSKEQPSEEPMEDADSSDNGSADESQEEMADATIMYEDFTRAKLEENLGNRPVALFFYADWCPTCQAMDAMLQENLTTLPGDAVILKANYDTETELKSEHGITVQSTVVFFDENGGKAATIMDPSLAQFEMYLASETKAETETSTDQDVSADDDTSAMDQNAGTTLAYESYSEAAFNEAIGTRPVAIFFKADWCPVCTAKDQEIKENIDQLPADAVIFRADFDSETELKSQYGVTVQTTFVFFDAAGKRTSTITDPTLEQITAQLSL